MTPKTMSASAAIFMADPQATIGPAIHASLANSAAHESAAMILWRPVGLAEMGLVFDSGMRRFPPRLPEQPIFYPVLAESYASAIARGAREFDDCLSAIRAAWDRLDMPAPLLETATMR